MDAKTPLHLSWFRGAHTKAPLKTSTSAHRLRQWESFVPLGLRGGSVGSTLHAPGRALEREAPKHKHYDSSPAAALEPLA